MEAAHKLTLRMHELVCDMAQPMVKEVLIVRAMQAFLADHGACMAYTPICTVQGQILHHTSYNNTLAMNDWLLVDAGAELDSGYCADVTRTYQIGGKMTGQRAVVYQAVRRAQQAVIDSMRPGKSFAQMHDLAAHEMVLGLIDIGVFKGSAQDVVSEAAYAIVFPHGVGHLIGLDVHDMESLGEDHVGYDRWHRRSKKFGPNHLRLGKALRKNMTVTVEPGLYFIPELISQWRAEQRHAKLIDYARLETLVGLGGVRIEDVVHVRSDCACVLSCES